MSALRASAGISSGPSALPPLCLDGLFDFCFGRGVAVYLQHVCGWWDLCCLLGGLSIDKNSFLSFLTLFFTPLFTASYSLCYCLSCSGSCSTSLYVSFHIVFKLVDLSSTDLGGSRFCRSCSAWNRFCSVTLLEFQGTYKCCMLNLTLPSLGGVCFNLIWIFAVTDPASAHLFTLTSSNERRNFWLMQVWSIWFSVTWSADTQVALWIYLCWKIDPR